MLYIVARCSITKAINGKKCSNGSEEVSDSIGKL